jgi:ribosomal RNA assembly protein
MEKIYIPRERMDILKKDRNARKLISRICHCDIEIDTEGCVSVIGTPYSEFIAKAVIYAFGRGFDINVARLLVDEGYYFSSIDLKQELGSEKRVKRIKARIIGAGGKTKKYIEGVSSAKISVYGDTVSFIGSDDEINEAETAVNTLITGGTHKVAYLRMEAAHRKNKEKYHSAKF